MLDRLAGFGVNDAFIVSAVEELPDQPVGVS
jgi:hypothetical protein